MIKPKAIEKCNAETWGDSAGWYCYAKLDGGYALVDSAYECLSVYRDSPNGEEFMAEDMEFSANYDDIVENHAEWFGLYESMARKLMTECEPEYYTHKPFAWL